MKIVIDSAIPYIKGVFEPYAEVVYIAGVDFTADIVHDADALIVRTRTKCRRELLEGSAVKHIATATIGYDHIDLDYCREQGIGVSSAAGCNARGVLHWIGAVLTLLSEREGWQPCGKSIGIVGVGNVGSLIKEHAAAWGFNLLCCDPPRARVEGDLGFVDIDELISRADIITLHTPLDESSYHLIDDVRLQKIAREKILINSSRGEVVDSRAMAEGEYNYKYIFDVWEGEPNLNLDLLANSIISTPHIAGYTQQGKGEAARMVIASIAHRFDLPIVNWRAPIASPSKRILSWQELRDTIHRHIDLEAESENLRRAPWLFEQQRNEYNYREEYF